jgi:histidine ammonia-lyase
MVLQIELDGTSLSAATLVRLSEGAHSGVNLALSADARLRVSRSRAVVDDIVEQNEVAYGINTGFGLFSNVIIPPEQLAELQVNLIRSHAAGFGAPLSRPRTRMLLALRANVLSKGHSGIRLGTLEKIIAAYNADCLSLVPCKGTVGASGDLAPLSHLALGLIGEGKMWKPGGRDDAADASDTANVVNAADALAAHGLTPIELAAKEGLAMINGTQLITALGAEAVERATGLQRCADLACAMSVEALKGTHAAFHPAVHASRPHRGQSAVAARLRALLCTGEPSEITRSHKDCGRVQDAYSLRCAPQVHGVVLDTINFVAGVIEVEMNSATDNPMVFTSEHSAEEEGFSHARPSAEGGTAAAAEAQPGAVAVAVSELSLHDARAEVAQLRQRLVQKPAPPAAAARDPAVFTKTHSDTFYGSARGFIISGGNFHGEYPAKVLDYLAIGVAELASISERRIERLVNPSLSGLPAFLVGSGGLHSGFMIAHCTAAAAVSENKVLCHPSSVDSISTSGSKEDHVSMGGFSARKALEVIENTETVVAIELLAACQAIEFLRPLRTTPALEAVHALVRSRVPALDGDRFMAPGIAAVAQMLRAGEIWATAEPFITGKGSAGAQQRSLL